MGSHTIRQHIVYNVVQSEWATGLLLFICSWSFVLCDDTV